jgi:hypothetical protein
MNELFSREGAREAGHLLICVPEDSLVCLRLSFVNLGVASAAMCCLRTWVWVDGI